MKKVLSIYAKTHPYVAMLNKRAIHLNERQYKAIIEDMGQGKGSTVITYRDPERGTEREIPINLYKIDMLDEASVVREELWRAQGGYVCKSGKLVENQQDCVSTDGYKKYEASGLMTNQRTWQKLGHVARANLLAGFLVGRYNKYGDLKLLEVMKGLEYNLKLVEKKLDDLKVYGLQSTDEIKKRLSELQVSG